MGREDFSLPCAEKNDEVGVGGAIKRWAKEGTTYGRRDGKSPPRLGEWLRQKTSASILGSLSLSQVSHSKQPATKFYEQSDVQCLSVWGETELSYQQPRMNMEADRQPLHMPAALAHDPTPSS